MKKLLIYLKEFRKETILAPLFKMLEASFELFVPLVVKRIVDIGIANQDKPYVLRMCLVMIALGVIGLICSITAQYFSAKAAVGFSTKLRHSLFTHIQSLSYAETDTLGTSTLITRMTSDINQTQNGVNMVLRLFLRSPFIVIGAMIMAFSVDATAAVTFVVVIPLLCIVVFGIMLLTIPLYKKVQNGLDQVLGITRSNLTGVRVLRAFHKEEEEIESFGRSNDTLTFMQLFVGKIAAIMNPVTYVIVNAGTIVLLWVGAVRVDTGLLTTGAVMALVNYMSQILVELVKLANLIITVNKAIACGNRVQAMFEVENSMKDGILSEQQEKERDSLIPIVEFKNVSMTYPGAGDSSLEEISFRAMKGQTIGIIGGTGSGKSSLINLIPRFYDTSEGQVLVNGVDVRSYTMQCLRDKIGVVPQKAVLFKGTIRDNLLMGNEHATEEQIKRALKVSQSAEFVESKPEKIETMITQSGKNLSGGQRQRLTIARALVREPEILLLDDSSSALDYATDAKLRQAIAGMPGTPTVFIVSQRAASLMNADQIIVLDDGNMVGIGTHNTLLASCATYQEIYYSQFPDERGKGVIA